jgi:ATP-dependent helicase/DNAse subunit B
METIIIPYGSEGGMHRKSLYSRIIAERAAPPFLFQDVLMIVPSARLRRTYGRLFLERARDILGTSAIVQPEIQTVHGFLQDLAAQRQERRLIDENSRLVLIEGIVKECIAGNGAFGTEPDIIAPALSSSVANMIDELSSAGVGPDRLVAAVGQSDFGDKAQVILLVRVFERYVRTMEEKGLMDPAGFLSFLAEHFDPSWLDAYSRIIIDGIHNANDMQAQALRKISATGKCTFLIEAPSPELVRNAGEYHPLTLTRELLGMLGLSAKTTAGEPDSDGLFLGQALFSNMTFAEAASTAPPAASFTRDIRLLSAVSMREEVTLIAGDVKGLLQQGTRPDAVLVAFPSLDDYGQLAEEIFRDHGIPYNRALGRQLSTSPVATAQVSLLKTAQDDFSGPSVLRILGSPFLKFGDDHALAPALDRLLRYHRIMGGKEQLLSAALRRSVEGNGKDIVSDPLRDLFAALVPFETKEPAPLSLWMDRLADLVSWSKMAERVALIKGPLNVNLQAYRKLMETMASLSHAGKQFPEYRYTFNEWFFLLKKTFMHSRFQVPPEDEGGVQILGIEESAGRAWDEVFLGGLVDGKFPQRLPQNIFLPEATLEQLGVRTLEKARLNAASHFYRLLLSAQRVTLTWPEHQGDKPVIPSPFLEELKPLRIAGLLNRNVEKTSGIQFDLTVKKSRSISELAKSISLAGRTNGLSTVLEADIEGMEGIRTALAFSPSTAATEVTPPAKRVFRVTELDDYLACPYDYYVKHVLGIAPLEEVTEDISPLARGSKVHAVLRQFYEEWKGPVTAEKEDKARELLRSLAVRAFQNEADTFRNRREKELFLLVMAERFLDAEKEFWKHGFTPAYLELSIESFQLPLPDETVVEIHAKVDRIDVDDKGNFMIVDYKTGAYPLPRTGLEQEIFQLPVYAVMAMTAESSEDMPLLKRAIGLVYYDLAGKYKGAARDVVLFNADVLKDQPTTKPRSSPKSSGEFEEILRRSMDKARQAVEGILSGDFLSRPQDEKKCRYCQNKTMCRREP